ncbi:MAG TPA: type II secretion system protein GspG [Dehalococcoidia bacterium]|nr:type II secretion system protein GspG [Dehalococcoidia bacterium]
MRIRLNVALPVGLLAIALAGVAWLDLTTGGEARPAPPIGAIGTPVRNAYIAPTATPAGQPTAVGRPAQAPTVAPGARGTPAERDQRRRLDLLLLVDAAAKYKTDKGSLPSTDGHVQSLCTYKNLDQGCKFASYLPGGVVPSDPVGNGYNYWYSSDGTTARFYTSLEQPLGTGELPCVTTDAELVKHANVICVATR